MKRHGAELEAHADDHERDPEQKADVGPDLRVLLPASIFAGGATLVVCDLAVRVLAPVVHTEVPVGAVD